VEKKIINRYKGNSNMGNTKFGMGWLRDSPDFRDYTMNNKNLKLLFSKIKTTKKSLLKVQNKMDLRKWCSPIEDQQTIGSCTAHAGVGMLEYFQRRAFGEHIDASRLFLYKVTRNLAGNTGDTGAYLRTTMGALALFGVPPENYWTYEISKFDEEPTSFIYSLAQNFQALKYYRLDVTGVTAEKLLEKIKENIILGLPAMFGFTVYSSYEQATKTDKIPFPTANENTVGGHAVMAVGFDDDMKIKNTLPGSEETKGAILFRNSWGTGWGEEGYGWLPYKYVLSGLAVDWWSLMNAEWIDTGQFGA
jgi:C1A family cysteine protease